MRIIEDENMVDLVMEPHPRSASRAQRRKKRGFPQHMRLMRYPKKCAYRIGDTFVMHPEAARALREVVPTSIALCDPLGRFL